MRHETQKAKAYYGLGAIVFGGMNDRRSFWGVIITAAKRSREIENSSVGWIQERSFLGRNGLGAIVLVCERREAIVLIAW